MLAGTITLRLGSRSALPCSIIQRVSSPSTAAGTPRRSERAPFAAIALALLGALALAAFHLAVFFPTWADENVHVYVAGRVAAGAVLYRDIHSARPPLALAPLIALLALKVPPLLAARASVMLACWAIALVLALAGGRLFGTTEGLVAALLFLVAPETAARFAYTGIHTVALGAAACAALALLDRPRLAGLAAGLALASGQHALVLVACAGVWIATRSRRDALAFAAAALAASALVYGAAAALGGKDLARDLIGRHLYHLDASAPGDDGDIRWFLPTVALENLSLLALAMVALARPPRADGARSFTPRVALAAMVSLHVAVVALMKGGLVLYLFPAHALIALLAADGALRLVRGLRAAATRSAAFGVSLAVLALSVLGFWAARGRYERRDAHPYSVIPQVRLAAMSHLQRLSVAETIARVVEADSTPEETLFGFPTLVTQVAVSAHRRVAGELADLAPRWIQLGSVTRQSVVRAIEADHVRFLVTPRWFYFNDPYFKSYLAHCFGSPRVFPRTSGEGGAIPDILLYRHRDGACPN